MLRACLGFAGDGQCGICGPATANTSATLSYLLSEKVLDAQTGAEAPWRESDPHEFSEEPNRKHPRGAGPPRAARSAAFGELQRRPPSRNSLSRNRLSSTTLLGQEPAAPSTSRIRVSLTRVMWHSSGARQPLRDSGYRPRAGLAVAVRRRGLACGVAPIHD